MRFTVSINYNKILLLVAINITDENHHVSTNLYKIFLNCNVEWCVYSSKRMYKFVAEKFLFGHPRRAG
jgi:hypothetical protein